MRDVDGMKKLVVAKFPHTPGSTCTSTTSTFIVKSWTLQTIEDKKKSHLGSVPETNDCFFVLIYKILKKQSVTEEICMLDNESEEMSLCLLRALNFQSLKISWKLGSREPGLG